VFDFWSDWIGEYGYYFKGNFLVGVTTPFVIATIYSGQKSLIVRKSYLNVTFF